MSRRAGSAGPIPDIERPVRARPYPESRAVPILERPTSEPVVVPQEAVGRIITKDIFFVGYLLSSGLWIRELQYDRHSRRGRVTFVIEGPRAKERDEEYRRQAAIVNLAALRLHMETAKDMMFDFLRSRETVGAQSKEHEPCNIHRNISES